MTDDQLIEDYLLGKLTAEARQTFELRLQQDPALATEVQIMNAMLNELDDAGRERFEKGKQEAIQKLTQQSFFSQFEDEEEVEQQLTTEELLAFQQIGRERFDQGLEQAKANLESQGFFKRLEQQGGRSRRRWIIGIAAAAVTLLIPVLTFIYPNTNQQLYESAFTVDTERVERIVKQMGFARNEKNQFEAAVRAADVGRYKEANILVDSFLNSNPIPFLRRYGEFLSGMLQMEVGKMDEAQELLTPLAEDEDFHDQAAATWFLGLVYLQKSDVEQAKQILQEVPESSNYFEPAQEILEKLKS